MANGPAHLAVGIATGITVAIIDKQEQQDLSHNALVAGGLGSLFGRLPDMLEPALNNPHHRRFFHSFVVAGAIGYTLKKAYEWEPENNLDKLLRGVCLIGGTAYLSHLALDACTNRSLPMIGKL